VALAVLLHGILALSERRAEFVSAVTHELRTPLTTFCLYSQMLADGIVTEGEAQKSYFQTLKIESLRLARIVESVLDYARLSGRSMPRACTDLAVESLIGSLTRVLSNRCEQSGMLLEVTIAPQVGGQIRTDPTIVERILFNLVENACKYAVDAEDPTVHLDITADAAWLKLAVRDHGPGIDPADQPRIFRPFTRGKLHAHGGIPGLGLGLALAQGLAKELGGHLELAPTEDGACFVLSLPR
jgi:signal transduction histidine kinase